MGIDFGVNNTIYLAFCNNNKFYKVTKAPVFKRNRKLIKNKDIPYEIIDRFNYETAMFVIGVALKHHVKIIQMEDLAYTNFTNNSFYFELQRQIQFLSLQFHIMCKYVNKHLSSQKCSVCGFTHKDNRINQKEFKCKSCGYSANADYNAAKNISNANVYSISK